MGKVIAILNQKGGVGKTTTTLNLGCALIDKGYKVLLIDFDPQSSLTISMQIKPHELKKTIYSALHGEPIKNCILTDNDKFYFLPTNINLAAAETELVNEIGRESILREKLETIREEFDYILIDCPPSLGLLNINTLVASDYIIVPMSCDFLSYMGYTFLLDTVAKVKKLNSKLEIMGILPTMYDSRNNHSKEVLEIMQTNKCFKTIIKHSVMFKDASSSGQPIRDINKNLGSLYEELADEVINYGK